MADTAGQADAAFMARALALAGRGRLTTRPNPAVGAVIVAAGRVVGEGWHEQAGLAHAEIVALQAAGSLARGATCYVTLEPCAHHGRTGPCADALIAAGVGRVVVASADPNPLVAGEGIARLRASGIEVQQGLMEGPARALNRGFLQRMASGRPYLRLKIAASLDGRTAMASGESQWITGPAARADVQRLRAASGAILTGIDTVLADDPRLTVRGPLAAQLPGQPLRVVADSALRIPARAKLLHEPGECLLLTAVADARPPVGATVLSCPGPDGRVDLAAALTALGQRQVNDVLAEAGPRLSGALLAGGLVDELVLYLAPRLLGDGARGLASLPGLERLADAPALDLVDTRQVGGDLRLTLVPARAQAFR